MPKVLRLGDFSRWRLSRMDCCPLGFEVVRRSVKTLRNPLELHVREQAKMESNNLKGLLLLPLPPLHLPHLSAFDYVCSFRF